MEFTFNKEEESFRQEVRDFLAKEVPSDWKQRGPAETRGCSPREGYQELRRHLAAKAGEKGWLSMAWPEEYGGSSNSSHIKSMIFVEESASYVELMENEKQFRATTVKFLTNNDIDYIDALDALRGQLKEGIQPYPVSRDGHPNSAGHKAIATYAGQQLGLIN